MRVLRNLIFSLSYLTVLSLLLSFSLCRDQHHIDNKFLNEQGNNKLNERIKSTGHIRKYNFNIEDDYYTQIQPLLVEKLEVLTNFVAILKMGVPAEVKHTLSDNLEYIILTQNQEWVQLVSVVSNITQIDLADIVLANIMYELMCTSIVIDSSMSSLNNTYNSNEIFMGRNLDFAFKDVLSDLGYEGYYYRNNKLEYITQGLIGYIAPLNGVKIGKFSLSLNERFTEKSSETSLNLFISGYTTSTFLLYLNLLNSNSYSEVIENLSTVNITSPCYYIVSGVNKNEGAVLTRSYERLVDKDELDVDNGKWFLVETNFDRSESDSRREAAERRLNEMKSNNVKINYNNLMSDVLALYPTNNNHTVYSTVQSSFNGGHMDSIYY